MSQQQRNNVVSYCRVSTDKQVLEGEGLAIQAERIEQFCERNNFTIVKSFADEGISGAIESADRPGLMDLLSFCQEGNINYVIVDKMDRIARMLVHQLFIEKELLKYSIKILYASQDALNGDSDDMMVDAMRQMMAVFAELERKMIKKRLSDGTQKKASKGNKPSGRQPFGYTYAPDGYGTVVNQAEATIVYKAFVRRIMGHSLQQIADHLNELCTFTMRMQFNPLNQKRKWTRYSVRDILTNDYYRGIVTHNGTKIQGNHEPIINDEIWNGVHKRSNTTKKMA
jgi:DNA invertase Pin-like site-specific DNA recombinase